MVAADFMLFVRRVHGRITEEKFTCSPLKPVKRRERERLRERELFIELKQQTSFPEDGEAKKERVRALFCERAEDTRASSDDDDEDTLLKPQMTNQFSTRERSGKNSIEFLLSL